MAELEREQSEIAARLAVGPQDITDIHPGLAEIDKRKVERWNDSLADLETRPDASSDIRSPVGKIVLHPGAKRGQIHATLHRSLMGIVDFANDNPSPGDSREVTSAASGSPR